jgi:hypothetical protein
MKNFIFTPKKSENVINHNTKVSRLQVKALQLMGLLA